MRRMRLSQSWVQANFVEEAGGHLAGGHSFDVSDLLHWKKARVLTWCLRIGRVGRLRGALHKIGDLRDIAFNEVIVARRFLGVLAVCFCFVRFDRLE